MFNATELKALMELSIKQKYKCGGDRKSCNNLLTKECWWDNHRCTDCFQNENEEIAIQVAFNEKTSRKGPKSKVQNENVSESKLLE